MAEFDDYLNLVNEVFQNNNSFITKNQKGAYEEVIGLSNDAIDYIGKNLNKPNSLKKSINDALAFFLNHVLTPYSNAIYLNMLAGNLPGCFVMLRMMLEILVIAFAADYLIPDIDFSKIKFDALYDFLKEGKISISKLMVEIGKELNAGRSFSAEYGKLSEKWVHSKGLVTMVQEQIIEKSDVPPWGLVIPMEYKENDIDSLFELGKFIAEFRRLLSITMEKYFK